MNFLVGSDWRDRFDLVIVEAKKPKFFTQWSSPLRRYDLETKSKTWSQVTKIEKGEVYCEVNIVYVYSMLRHASECADE